MCFVVDSDAPIPGNLTAWKVVNQELKSTSAPPGVSGLTHYAVGTRVYAQGEQYVKPVHAGQRQAAAGIYVYLTHDAVLRGIGRSYVPKGYKVIEVQVNPADFLYTDGKGVATYRSVFVNRVVPEGGKLSDPFKDPDRGVVMTEEHKDDPPFIDNHHYLCRREDQHVRDATVLRGSQCTGRHNMIYLALDTVLGRSRGWFRVKEELVKTRVYYR